MAQFEQHFVQDLTQQIKVRHCGSIVFNADNESNVVSVRLFNGSEPVAISGSVVGAVVCSDGSTVPLTGSYSGNTASITLTGDCFAVLGQIGVGIQIVNGTQKTTVLKVIYNVETLTTENVVDPGSRITLEVGDLIAAIDEAVATIPEDYSALTSEVEDIKAVNKIFNRDVVGVPNPIDTATWIDNANLNDSGAVKAAQGWKVTQGYIETSADSYKISYNNSETSYIVQVAGYTSNGSFVRMFANADSSSGVCSFTIDTTSVDKIRIATRYGNPILSVYPNDGKIVEKFASVEDDVSDLKSAIDSVEDEALAAFPESSVGPADMLTVTDGADDIPLKTLSVAIEPVQNLHGYDKPWFGGSGVNQSPITVQGIKAASTHLTWNGNSATSEGITFTILTDNDGNVIGLNVNGTSTGTAYVKLYDVSSLPLTVGSMYRMNGLWENGSATTFKHDLIYGSASVAAVDITKDTGTTFTFSQETASSERFSERLVIYSGQTISNQKFYPMISASNSTVSPYEPYANICPISGWDEETVTRTGKNLFPSNISWTNGIRDDNGDITTSSSKFSEPVYGIKPSTRYMLQGTIWSSTAPFRVYFLKADGTWISRTTPYASSPIAIDTPANCGAIQLQINQVFNPTDIQFEEGSTATAYEPYQGQTVSVNLSSVAGGTVYGGTLTINSDGSGTLVVDRIYESLENINVLSIGSSYLGTGKYAELGDLSHYAKATSIPVLNNMGGTSFVNRGIAWQMYIGNGSVDSKRIFTFVPADATAESIASVVHASKICYEISDPTTYSLTATQLCTLLGTNTVWADAGQVTMEYRKDPNTVIDELEARDLTTAQKKLLVDLFSSTSNTGRVSGDPVTAGTYVLKCDVVTATGRASTFTFKWVRES